MNHKPQYYANLACRFLNRCKAYSSNKAIIEYLFKYQNVNTDLVKCRLAIIDKLYSTFLNNKTFQLEIISEEICAISKNSDQFLSNLFKEYLKNPDKNSKIKNLFGKEYGYLKSKKALSAISKYAFFVTRGNFPIHDSIVKGYARSFCKKFNIDVKGFRKNFISFIKAINKLNEDSNIKNFCKLDKLLWLIGKIQKEGYATILGVKQFEELELLRKKYRKRKIKTMIEDKRTKKELLKIFSKYQIEFIEFALAI